MLDLVARGEFDPAAQGAATGRDELSVMASKVSLLGQRLRGAQFEVSDLRGNIDRLLQDLEDAVFIFNREGQLVFASGAVEKFLGRERAELSGQAIADIFPPIEHARPADGASRADRPPGAQPARAAPPRRRAAVCCGVAFGGLGWKAPPGAAGAGAGLLVRLRDPEAQRKIGRELQTADRLAAISRITSGVAHEVKNPLNAILLHVEVARAKLTRGDLDIVQQMEIISREILRLDRVVKTFLDFTRPVELKLSQRTGERDCWRKSRNWRGRRRRRPRSGWNREHEAEGVEVRVDRDLLKQAMLNVVVNAMEAMPEGGDLTLRGARPRTSVELRISDTGAGIPPELREKIFRLYFTTKKEGSGHRAGDDVPDRATPRWYNRFHQRTGKGNDLPDPPADCGVAICAVFQLRHRVPAAALRSQPASAGCVWWPPARHWRSPAAPCARGPRPLACRHP